MSGILQSHTKEHKKFVKKLNSDDRVALANSLNILRQKHSEIINNQQITEKLQTLAYYLGVLSVNRINKDYKTSKRLMKKFIGESDLSIKQLLFEIKIFESEAKKLKKHYHSIIEFAGKKTSLEDSVELNKNNLYLNKLLNLCRKQKTLAIDIGSRFIDITKKLMEDREFQANI